MVFWKTNVAKCLPSGRLLPTFQIASSTHGAYTLHNLNQNFVVALFPQPMQSLPQCCLAQHDASDGHVQKKLCEFLENPKTVDDQLYLSSEVLGKLGSVLGE